MCHERRAHKLPPGRMSSWAAAAAAALLLVLVASPAAQAQDRLPWQIHPQFIQQSSADSALAGTAAAAEVSLRPTAAPSGAPLASTAAADVTSPSGAPLASEAAATSPAGAAVVSLQEDTAALNALTDSADSGKAADAVRLPHGPCGCLCQNPKYAKAQEEIAPLHARS